MREEAIKRTGRYLLQGWAMSAYHCQTCSSVLVHRGERFVCPGCEVPLDNGDTSGSAIREGAYDSIVHTCVVIMCDVQRRSLARLKKPRSSGMHLASSRMRYPPHRHTLMHVSLTFLKD